MAANAKRGRGRPVIGRPVMVRCTDEQRSRLWRAAERRRVPVAELLREIISAAV